MTSYTIGIYFNWTMTEVCLILKNRPQWQAGKYNFPGGHIEPNEGHVECIIREFNEECGVLTTKENWKRIGVIKNTTDYNVHIFTAVQSLSHPDIRTNEDQKVAWFSIDELPENVISNIPWLVIYAHNAICQGNNKLQGHFDNLIYGTFEYEYGRED